MVRVRSVHHYTSRDYGPGQLIIMRQDRKSRTVVNPTMVNRLVQCLSGLTRQSPVHSQLYVNGWSVFNLHERKGRS